MIKKHTITITYENKQELTEENAKIVLDQRKNLWTEDQLILQLSFAATVNKTEVYDEFISFIETQLSDLKNSIKNREHWNIIYQKK